MNHSNSSFTPSEQPERSPLTSNWTIAEVIDWIAAEDERAVADDYRDALGAIEAGLARTLGLPACAPSARTPFVVRSIVALVQGHPSISALTIAEATAIAAPNGELARRG